MRTRRKKRTGSLLHMKSAIREENPRCILDLVARIVTLSVKTMKTIDALPALEIRDSTA